MAQPSKWPTKVYPSTHFLESAGCILFDFRGNGEGVSVPTADNGRSTEIAKVVLFYNESRGVYLLPKGRRNIGEARKDAAIRETYEETGLRCSLLPVTLQSRATSIDPTQDRTNSDGYTLDEVRTFANATDPFTCMLRYTGPDEVKLIWWYIASVDDVQDENPLTIDPDCVLVSVPISEAVKRCTFENDREVVAEAIRVVTGSFRLT